MTPAHDPVDELRDLHMALVQSWNIAPPHARELTRDAVHDALLDRVRFLLKHDFDKLTSALYILDVPERRFNEAMGADGVEGKAQALADAIWDREFEKLHTRRRYKHDRSIETTYEVKPPDPPGDES